MDFVVCEGLQGLEQNRSCHSASSSARGCGAATPLLLGSATQKVLAHSRIPVLVYRKSAAIADMPNHAAVGKITLPCIALRPITTGRKTMIRLSEIRLPLSALPSDPDTQPEAALRARAAQALGLVDAADIATLRVFKRSFDARKVDLLAVYIVDITLADPTQQAALLEKFAGNPHIQPTPDMAWHPVGQAPAELPLRPVVVGFGPCGIFAALVLAQMGFKPIVLERGKNVRERTQDTWGLWRKRELNPESNVQLG